MNTYVQVLDGLPADGLRLNSGLALRLTSGNGMAVLGCSRLDSPPSDDEMKRVQDAVWQLFQPEILLQANTVTLLTNEDGQHRLRRLYWPLEEVAVVKAKAVQGQLFGVKA